MRLPWITCWQTNSFSYFRLKNTDLDPKKIQPEKILPTHRFRSWPLVGISLGQNDGKPFAFCRP